MKHVSVIILLTVILSISGLFAQNNSLDFDGTDDYVALGNPTALSQLGNGSYTIEAWIKTGSEDSRQTIIGNYDGTPAWVFELHETGNLRMYINDYGYNSSAEVDDNQWHHVTGVRDFNNNIIMYLDGIEVYNNGSESEGSFTVLSSTSIGRNPSSTFALHFNGNIDELRIWNDVRTEDEIRQNMYQELNGDEANLVAYYPCNAASGTNLDDETINNNDGTLNNMDNNDWVTSPAMFGPKNCLDFAGNQEHVRVATLSPSFTQGTISFWINPKATPVNHARVLSDYWDDDEIYLFSGAGNVATWHMIDGDELMSSNPLPNNIWTHVAITMDNSSSKLYINGILDDESGPSDTDISTNFEIGGYSTSGNYEVVNGYLDEFCFWSDVRTEEEIRENMCKTLTGNEENLIAYYNFDNTSGTILQDFSGNGNDGTLTNMDNADWVSSDAFNTWLNTDDNSWATSGNWSGGVPVATDNVGIYSYSGGTDVSLSGSPTLENLILGGSSAMTLSSGATITGTLFLESDLDLNGQTITLGSSATLVEDGGVLSGSSGSIITTRTLNNIDEDVAGLGAEITTASNMGSTVITRQHALAGSQAINRRYEIYPTNNTGLNATLVFHYFDSELNGHTESELELFRSEDGDTWTEQSASTVDVNDNTITLTSIDAFSHWTAAPAGSDESLPVELTSFASIAGNNKVTMNWATASEINNEAFILQRSMDNEIFETVAEINGAGNSNEVKEYSFTDNLVANGNTYYYKLGDRNVSGTITWHNTVQATPNTNAADLEQNNALADKFQLFANYPNPFNPETNIRFTVPNGDMQTVRITVFNNVGQIVKTLFSGELSGGEYQMTWNGTDDNGIQVPSGIYFLHMSGFGFVKTQKMVLMR